MFENTFFGYYNLIKIIFLIFLYFKYFCVCLMVFGSDILKLMPYFKIFIRLIYLFKTF